MRQSQRSIILLRDIALLVLLIWTFAEAILMVFVPESSTTIYILAFLIMDLAVVISSLGRTVAGIAVAGTLSCVWVGWKLYSFYASGALLSVTDYIMAVMPLLGVGISVLFEDSERRIHAENHMLRKQVEERVMVDEVTGLYNERAMYHDLQVMIHYAQRNNKPITLMLIRLRYEEEFVHMLPSAVFAGFVRELAEVVDNSVRVEDRVYCLSSKGAMAIILTCTAEMSQIIKARIIKSVSEAKFEALMEGDGKPDLRFAVKEYSKDYGSDMMAFRKAAESELAYDV